MKKTIVASSLAALLGISSLACGEAFAPCGSLTSGAALQQEQSVFSCNGEFELKLQSDGNLVLYHGGHDPSNATWATGTNGLDGSQALMQGDGNFVLYNAAGTTPDDALFASATQDHPGAWLDLANDGTLTVTHGNEPFWTFTSGDVNASGLAGGGGGSGGCSSDSDCSGSCGGDCYQCYAGSCSCGYDGSDGCVF